MHIFQKHHPYITKSTVYGKGLDTMPCPEAVSTPLARLFSEYHLPQKEPGFLEKQLDPNLGQKMYKMS